MTTIRCTLTWMVRLWGIFLAGYALPAGAEESRTMALVEVHAAVAAMGGEHLLESIHSIDFSAVGHRNMLEQSLRPDGPWWQDYFQETVTRDFQDQRVLISSTHRGYSSPQW